MSKVGIVSPIKSSQGWSLTGETEGASCLAAWMNIYIRDRSTCTELIELLENKPDSLKTYFAKMEPQLANFYSFFSYENGYFFIFDEILEEIDTRVMLKTNQVASALKEYDSRFYVGFKNLEPFPIEYEEEGNAAQELWQEMRNLV